MVKVGGQIILLNSAHHAGKFIDPPLSYSGLSAWYVVVYE